MSQHIYHPNKSSTGFACSFQDSSNDSSVFVTLVKQAGWDEKTGNGVFKASMENPEKNVKIKLSDTEVAAFLDCVERNRPFQSFHDNEEGAKTIQFSPWMAKPTTPEEALVQRGFSLSITATKKQDAAYKNSFYIGLTFAEARLIREYLLFCLNNHFTLERQQEIERFKQSYKKEVASGVASEVVPKTVTPTQTITKPIDRSQEIL